MIDFKYLFDKLKQVKNPEDLFVFKNKVPEYQKEIVHLLYSQMATIVHPDKNGGTKESVEAIQLLNEWRQKAYEKIDQKRWGQKDSGVIIQASKVYKNVTYITSGDICDVYISEQENGPRAVIKIVMDPKDQDFVQNEAKILKRLRTPTDKEAIVFQQYLPKLIEQTRVKVDGKEKIANIIEACEHGYTLEQVHNKHSVGLDERNVAWIWKRILEGIGWVNLKQKIIHGALLPSHIMVYPKNHGICLLDWSYAVDEGSPLKAISAKYKHFYPPEVFKKGAALPGIDIYMAAKCAMYLLGGDMEKNLLPSRIHPLLCGFIQACLLPNPIMRYRDTWEALEALSENLRSIYGPRKFVELEM